MANEWNTSYPIDHTLISAVPGEIRTLKTSCKTQIDREHETPVDGDATGGEHSSGSAVAYEGTTTPTNRPDGSTALADNAIDRGRIWFDDNYDPPLTKRWDGSAFEEVNAKSRLTFSGATVFNTSMTAADTFQDLDLSGQVGSNGALVILEVKANNATHYALKTKGYGSSDPTKHWGTATHGGCALYTSDAGDYATMVCVTDSNGVLQHASDSASDTFTIKLIAYMT